ncbi:MAG: TldD/PmbA family protein [Halanaerobiales bacterium]|nr:TldD/PmbA family protein [Halanaerobiales bacterium]
MIDFKKWIDFGLTHGAEEIEFYFERIKSNKIQIFTGDVESLLTSTSQGIGVRVIFDGKIGFAYTSNLTSKGLKTVIIAAIDSARLVQKSELHKFSDKGWRYPEVEIFDSELGSTELEEKIRYGIELERSALDFDPRIVRIPLAKYEDEEKEVYIVNSKGLNEHYNKTIANAILTAIANENNENQTGLGIGFGKKLSDLDSQKIGEQAARQAISLLGATAVPTQEVSVLFSPYAGSLLCAPFGSGFLAGRVQKNKSYFKGKLGEKVASSLVTLIDDGLLEGGFQTTPFDDEGIPSQKTIVVEKGILKSYLYDTYSAGKAGISSTGNSRRKSYQELPESTLTNFYLQPGNYTKEEMISEMKEGLYILNLSGVGSGTNPISGDFSVGALGIWIKDGKLTHPVSGVIIAGNFFEMLNDIVQIGNDMSFNFITKFMGMPSILVRKLMVTGI